MVGERLFPLQTRYNALHKNSFATLCEEVRVAEDEYEEYGEAA